MSKGKGASAPLTLTLEEMHQYDRIILAEDIKARGYLILELIEDQKLWRVRGQVRLIKKSLDALIGGQPTKRK